MDPHLDNVSLFQQIGQIQGSLTALNANISDFKSEFRSMTTDQNGKIEALRKDFSGEIKELSAKVEKLEEFRSRLDGANEEAKRSARWSGATTGAGVSISIAGLYELFKLIIPHIKL